MEVIFYTDWRIHWMMCMEMDVVRGHCVNMGRWKWWLYSDGRVWR